MKFFGLPFLLLIAACGESGSPNIAISDAWARPTRTAAQPAVVYLKILNSGDADDRLIQVQSERGRASLHTSELEGAVMRMRPVTEGVKVAAGATVELKPQGMHVMIAGLGKLTAGSHIPLRLTFSKSGDRNVAVAVANDLSDIRGPHQ